MGIAVFFIDTDTGQVATQRQLIDARVAPTTGEDPPRPWFRIKGTNDATTMWYAVLRKPVKDKYIGALAFRHSDHHALLLQQGWQEIEVDEIRGGFARRPPS